MKRNIKIFIILMLICFRSCSAMQKEDIEQRIEGIKNQKRITSLVEFAAIPLADKAIKFYDEHGFVAMVNYLSNLEVWGNKIPEELIDKIYFMITKRFKRGTFLSIDYFPFMKIQKQLSQ